MREKLSFGGIQCGMMDKDFFNKDFMLDWFKRLLKTATVAVLLLTLSVGLSGAWWNFWSNDSGSNRVESTRKSQLAAGNAITDPKSLLRYALPIDNEAIRSLQADIEDVYETLRTKRWGALKGDVKSASTRLNFSADEILADIPEEYQGEAEAIISQMKEEVAELSELAKTQDKEQIEATRDEILRGINQLEKWMVTEFPFEVPAEYANLPQLKGRATVEMETNKGTLTIVLDGYSAPVNAGNFVDLVQRGFYDGLDFIRTQDDYYVQTGKPSRREDGFIDPATGEYRAIPLEVLIKGDELPIYEFTLEEYGIYLADIALPFSAYGTVALAHAPGEPNGGSSQVFFFLFDNELTPPGFNLLDGRYSVFGYMIKGKDVLANLKPGDQVISATVTDGAENLVQPAQS